MLVTHNIPFREPDYRYGAVTSPNAQEQPLYVTL